MEFSDCRYAGIHRLTVDTYSLQHADPYMISAKSFAAHLTGMCCAMEHDGDHHLLRTLQQWLSGKREDLEKPPLLQDVGELTIAHILDAPDAAEHERLVREWASNVWNAYAVYHDLARDWIDTAKREQGEWTMGLSQALLPELDHEMANTRKVIERIPNEKLDWKPHDKSMAFVGLATHLSNIPSWTVMTIQQDSFDMAPEGGEPHHVKPVTSVDEALETFDRNVADARAAIEGASDEHLLGEWTFLSGGEVIFSMPRVAVVRSMVLNHVIHHRAQLGLYLRLNDIAVPAVYGPTADEAP
jgi:uncharacterized damage-inducible protein DinB